MSHTTRINSIMMVDETAIKNAIRLLKAEGVKCDLLENAVPRAYYSSQAGMGQAEFVVKLHDAEYDVGLYKGDNGYEARTDFYRGSVERVLGVKSEEGVDINQARLGKLYQAYAVEATKRAAIQKGYNVNLSKTANGGIQLQIAV